MDETLINTGLVFCMSSGLLFHFRLYQFNNYLRNYYVELWEKHAWGNNNLHWLAKLNRLQSFVYEYDFDNAGDLQVRVKSLRFISKTSVLGLIIICIGVALSFFN